jgi:hypothetical protein
MKKTDTPQDKSALASMTREVCYVKNKDGKYETELSTGWEVKTDALNNAWDDINEQVEEAKQAVRKGEKSPIHYYFVLQLMDFKVLSGYTGIWAFFIKRHMTSKGFSKLSDKKLAKYAKAFDITIDELKKFKGK